MLVFGHKSPDTDSTGSAIIWAWYLNNTGHDNAQAVLLGEPNTEAAFVLKHWNFDKPDIIDDVSENQSCVIVDTNNPAELPNSINTADIVSIIDHHKLTGGLETKKPIDMTIRPLACTATIMYDLMGDKAAEMPDNIKGLVLSCILSDTLAFRSPTTTDHDKKLAEDLAKELNVSLHDYADEMFAAKSDISAFSDEELLRMDSKEYSVGGKKFRVSVLETTSPKIILDRKSSLCEAMKTVEKADGVDQVLLFVIDILKEEAVLLVPNALVKSLAEKSFNVTCEGDTVILPGVMSRKKQIIPVLTL